LTFVLLWQALGWLMVALVVVFSLLPQPPEPPLITWDKSQHLLTYGVLMFWFRIAFAERTIWVGFLVGLGITLEFLQACSGYRYFEYTDMLANTLGVLVGLLLAATPLATFLELLDRRLVVWTKG
jgi:VanZ family protein